MFIVTLCTLPFLLPYVSSNTGAAWANSGLVPSLIPAKPRALAKVEFGAVEASLGNVMTEAQTIKQPNVSFPSAHGYFTLVMVDPDAPSREHPMAGQWLHWLVINAPISGDSLNVLYANVLKGYQAPSPPPGTEYHRYTVLLFKQKRHLNAASPYGRANFNIQSFAGSNGLGTIPDAGNFFYVYA